MNKVKGIVRTHLADYWSWLLIPLFILGISFTINLIIGISIGEELKTGGLSSIFVYMFVVGIISVGQTFPFLIGFGARRRDFFLGSSATIALFGVGWVTVLLILAWIERQTGYWGGNLHYFNIDHLMAGSMLEQFWLLFATMIHMFFGGFVIACLYRRFGRNGLYFFFIALMLALTCLGYSITYFGDWIALFEWLMDLSALVIASGLFVLALVYVAFSYAFIRKATV